MGNAKVRTQKNGVVTLMHFTLGVSVGNWNPCYEIRMLHAIGVCIAHARNRKCQVLGLPFASSIELIPELVSYATSVKCEIKANASLARISPQAGAKLRIIL